MQVAEVHPVDGGFQIGGGAGYLATRVREAQDLTRAALDAITGQGNDIPVIGPHPREAALAAVREAVIHLNEAVTIVAPEDALIDTRHALEELTQMEAELVHQGNAGIPFHPGTQPVAGFQRAIALLIRAEQHLAPEVAADPDAPHIWNDNGGVVPPWMR